MIPQPGYGPPPGNPTAPQVTGNPTAPQVTGNPTAPKTTNPNPAH